MAPSPNFTALPSPWLGPAGQGQAAPDNVLPHAASTNSASGVSGVGSSNVSFSTTDHHATFRSMSMLIRGGAGQTGRDQYPPPLAPLLRAHSAEEPHSSPAPHSALSVLVSAASIPVSSSVPSAAAAAAGAEGASTSSTSSDADAGTPESGTALADAFVAAAAAEASLDEADEADEHELAAMTEAMGLQRTRGEEDEDDAQLADEQEHASQPSEADVVPVDALGSSLSVPSTAHSTRSSISRSSSKPSARSVRRAVSPRTCTNPLCAERLQRERTEFWRLLDAKAHQDPGEAPSKELLLKQMRVEQQRAARDIAAKDARIAALEKTQRMLLASAAPGAAARALAQANDELQVLVAKLRAQVESLGGVPVSPPPAASSVPTASAASSSSQAPTLDASSSSGVSSQQLLSQQQQQQSDEPDQLSQLVSDPNDALVEPVTPGALSSAMMEPFFNTSAPRSVTSKSGSRNNRRRSQSFGSASTARQHLAAATAAAAAVATTPVLLAPAPAAAAAISVAKPSLGDVKVRGSERSPARNPSRPQGQPLRARANSLRATTDVQGGQNGSHAGFAQQPPQPYQWTAPSPGSGRSVRQQPPTPPGRSRVGGAPATPVSGGSSAAGSPSALLSALPPSAGGGGAGGGGGPLSLTVSGELAPVTSTRRPSHSSTSLFSKPLARTLPHQSQQHGSASTATLSIDVASGSGSGFGSGASPPDTPPRSPRAPSSERAEPEHAFHAAGMTNGRTGSVLFGAAASGSSGGGGGAGRTRAFSSGGSATASSSPEEGSPNPGQPAVLVEGRSVGPSLRLQSQQAAAAASANDSLVEA